MFPSTSVFKIIHSYSFIQESEILNNNDLHESLPY